MTRDDGDRHAGTDFSLPDNDPREELALAFLGHDLRAALSDVIGGLRLIAPEALDVETRTQMDRVRASGEVLARLLERGVTAMLGNAGSPPLEVINLYRFLDDLALRWSGRAQALGVQFDLVRQGGLPVMIRGDRVALDRILSNLLGNAFRYADHGRVTCSVELRRDGWLGFTVRDLGPGFPAALLTRARATYPHTTYARPTGMTKPGSGMGLRIAADLAQQLGGRITLHNLDPHGAEAQVDLPLAEMPLIELAEPGIPNAAGAPFLIGKRILVADDNATSRLVIHRFAVQLGAEVVLVSDGVEAVGRLEREEFDLLIVDLEMPRLSGLDVIRCLRALPGRAARTPVVAITAHALRSKRDELLAAGGTEMLSKPLLCADGFASVIRTAMNIPGHPQPEARPATPALHPDRLYRLLTLAGPETGRELLHRLMQDLSGVEHGLTEAGAAQDWAAIRSHTHVLISLAGAVGAEHLQAGAEALNHLAHQTDGVALGGRLHDVLTLLDQTLHFVAAVRAQTLTTAP